MRTCASRWVMWAAGLGLGLGSSAGCSRTVDAGMAGASVSAGDAGSVTNGGASSTANGAATSAGNSAATSTANGAATSAGNGAATSTANGAATGTGNGAATGTATGGNTQGSIDGGDTAAAGSAAGAGGSGGEGELPSSPGVLVAPGELVIPLQPRATSTLAILFTQDETGRLTAEPEGVSLALGEEYPSVVRFSVTSLALSADDTKLNLSALDVESVSLTARLLDDATFEVSFTELGESVIHLTGERVMDSGERDAFDVDVPVVVRTVSEVILEGCAADLGPVLAGKSPDLTWFTVRDERGNPFTPANATGHRPVTLTVHATPDTELSALDGFSTLIAQGAPQVVTVTAGTGEVGRFQLLAREDVDSIEAWYSLEAPWTRGLTFESGMMQVVRFDPPGTVYVHPLLRVGGRALCGSWDEDWFELSSATPAACPVVAVDSDDLGTPRLAQGATAAAPGSCSLTLSAPTFGAAGLEDTLSIELLERTQE